MAHGAETPGATSAARIGVDRANASPRSMTALTASVAIASTTCAAPGGAPTRGVLLEKLTWVEAEPRLTPDAVVVIPLGAASKEHGPHLRLDNDRLLAEYFRDRVLEAADVVVAPTVGFGFYPAFTEYPGSISLRLETARDLVVDICTSLAAYGPRRFYVLNTGVSTTRSLAPAAEALARQGIVLRYTDLPSALGPTEKAIGQQQGGSHADETETSMMLVIAPETVDLRKAVKDYDPGGKGGLSRRPGGPATYSPTGTWGDPTLATRAKGERFVAALTRAILDDIEALRRSPLPAAPP
jgi:creatinine amidohydrolase